MILSFEGDSLEACIGEMRAFLALYEKRSPGGTIPAIAGGAYVGPALPSCPVHLVELDYRPAGRNDRGSYSASYRCPRPGCREVQWLDDAAGARSAGRRRSRR